MKRIAVFVLVVMTVSARPFAQGGRGAPPPPAPLEPGASQADVDKAVLALPENLRSQAMVVKWKPDFAYDTLSKGANGLVCYDRSGFPLQQPFSVECTASANLDREAQNLKARQPVTGQSRRRCSMIRRRTEVARNPRSDPFGTTWRVLTGSMRVRT